ncbi:tryptophan--tRNA ligase [Clostridium botulinum Bf]|nr:putative tryptophan--tRNA ligase [Clostridium botulinum CDC_1436]EEZ28456.1 tryptophan--tRNA ligase [Clostridium botulinum Bf]MBY6880984.1 anti-sigma factor [Clostridium botulinum]
MPFSLFTYIKINGKQPDSSSGSDPKYLNGHTYIDSDSINIGGMNLKNSFNVDLNVNNIYGVIGNWNFKFSVSKDEMSKHTKVFKPNTKVQFKDALVNVKKVSCTPINTIITVTGNYKDKSQQASKKREGTFKREMQIGQNLYEYDKWFVFDDKGNWVERKDTLDNVKKDKDNPNDYIMELDSLDENKKYKIGTNDL